MGWERRRKDIGEKTEKDPRPLPLGIFPLLTLLVLIETIHNVAGVAIGVCPIACDERRKRTRHRIAVNHTRRNIPKEANNEQKGNTGNTREKPNNR